MAVKAATDLSAAVLMNRSTYMKSILFALFLTLDFAGGVTAISASIAAPAMAASDNDGSGPGGR
jgi:hypothetical protein